MHSPFNPWATAVQLLLLMSYVNLWVTFLSFMGFFPFASLTWYVWESFWWDCEINLCMYFIKEKCYTTHYSQFLTGLLTLAGQHVLTFLCPVSHLMPHLAHWKPHGITVLLPERIKVMYDFCICSFFVFQYFRTWEIIYCFLKCFLRFIIITLIVSSFNFSD